MEEKGIKTRDEIESKETEENSELKEDIEKHGSKSKTNEEEIREEWPDTPNCMEMFKDCYDFINELEIVIENIKKKVNEHPVKILNNLDDIDHLMILMKKNRIDYVEIEGCKFAKSQHEVEVLKQDNPSNGENGFWVNPLNN